MIANEFDVKHKGKHEKLWNKWLSKDVDETLVELED
jgi:hypothetical protein